jgi:hypothetical protein
VNDLKVLIADVEGSLREENIRLKLLYPQCFTVMGGDRLDEVVFNAVNCDEGFGVLKYFDALCFRGRLAAPVF